MRVCWVGTHVPQFSRNRQLRDWLAGSGIKVGAIRISLWPADRLHAFSTSRWRLLGRAVVFSPLLFLKVIMAKRPDVYLVSYPGWFDMPVVKLAAMMRGRPVVFDPFISLYETAVSDRGLVDEKSAAARLARAADWLALRAADVVIADCAAHGRFFEELAGRSLQIEVLYVGADERVMYAQTDSQPEPRRVLFYGTFVPLHGTKWIVKAAALLEERGVPARVVMIGEGQERGDVEDLAQELGVRNVEFRDSVTLNDLSDEIRRAAVVLGIFGTSDKANRVIPHKVFEGAACGRPVITADTQAIREGFNHDELVLVPPGDAEALADALESLLSDADRLTTLGTRARKAFVERFSRGPQTDRLKVILESARHVTA